MAHAGIPPELRHAILAVHESCSYRVSHGPHSRTFAMARGVRQGCALSPLLYSIYSAWLYDQLVDGTNEEWASKLATLFADDSHVAFEIEHQDDLGFVLHAVRRLFELFRRTGMSVNPSKSSVVISLKGSAAKRWIRLHTCAVDGKPAINFGFPGQPLLAPTAPSMVYLGVVASYGRFEVATFQHRLKAAIHNKQRLQRILHSKRLSVRYRVRLVARSSDGLGLGRPSSPGVVPRAAQLRLRAGLQIPLVRFSNPVGMNLCYANSAVQARYWLRELSDSVESLQGTAQRPALLCICSLSATH